MELKELQNLFHAGALVEANVVNDVFAKGYNLLFKGKGGNKANHYSFTAQRDEEQPRVFKSIDAAISSAKSVGFREIKVHVE